MFESFMMFVRPFLEPFEKLAGWLLFKWQLARAARRPPCSGSFARGDFSKSPGLDRRRSRLAVGSCAAGHLLVGKVFVRARFDQRLEDLLVGLNKV